MQINDTTGGGQGLYQDCLFELSVQVANYPFADFIRNANLAQDKFIELVIESQSNWNFDSNNATDLPIGTTALIAGQQDYSFDISYLTINEPIRILNPDGITYTVLDAVNPADLSINPTQGIPTQYAKIGESLFLDPIPNYSMAAGLTAYFTRQLDYFAVTDTTKQPGFAGHLHKYISVYCAWAYAKAKNLPKLAQLSNDLIEWQGNEDSGGSAQGKIKRFYSKRTGDVKSAMQPFRECNR